jgi:hypothetical protein
MEARSYYCRPNLVYSENCSTSQALVIVPNQNETDKPKNRVTEMASMFENSSHKPIQLGGNKYRIKEQGIVIKVKKNQIEEDKINETHAKVESTAKTEDKNDNSLLTQNRQIDINDFEIVNGDLDDIGTLF